MYKIIILTCCILCISIVSNAQFGLENEYDTNRLVRTLLQDQSERYFFFNRSKTQLIYANGNHQTIDSIPVTGCDGFVDFRTIRNDYDDFGLGVIIRCGDTINNVTNFRLIDSQGEIKKEFESAPSIDDHYILEFNRDDYSTKIYETQSLELVDEMLDFRLFNISKHYDGLNYYLGHNGIDSLFVFDNALNIISSLKFNSAGGDLSNTSIQSGSIVESTGELNSYFIISFRDTVTNLDHSDLINGDGEVLFTFQDDIPKFHKHEQTLQALYDHDSGLVSSYSVNNNEYNSVITNFSTGSKGSYSTGKYIISSFDSQNYVATLYDFTGQIALQFFVDDPYALYGFKPFMDQSGNEYISYVQQIGNEFNTVILKDTEFLQVINNANNLIISDEFLGLQVKLIDFPNSILNPEELDIRVFGLGLTNVTDTELDEINLMPVPAKTKIFVKDMERYQNFAVYDLNNKLIQKGKITGSNLELEIEYLRSGMYFLTLERDDHSFITKKFIKID